MKLSERVKILLWIIDNHTKYENGKLSSFFVPQPYAYYPPGRSAEFVSGSDAHVLLGMERRGLIARPETSLPNKYVYFITAKGLAEMPKIHAEFAALEEARQKRLKEEE